MRTTHSGPEGWSKSLFAGLIAVMLSLTAISLVGAQSGTRQGSGAPQRHAMQQGSGARPGAQPPFEQRFWEYLQAARYQNWAPLPGATAALYPGEGPHGAFLKLYANRTAAGAPKQLPNGSILIKENYGPDQKTLMALTVMYRSKDYDSDNGDWYWVKYEPDGRVSQMAGMPVAGKVRMCVECHSGAAGGDFVFAND